MRDPAPESVVQDRKLLLAGAAGLAGASLLLVGDFLLYAHPANLPVVAPAISDALGPRQAILLASPAQLTISSIIGPLAAALYAFGAWHIYRRLLPASGRWAAMAGISWLTCFCLSGAYHALWGPLGLAAQFANGNPQGAALLEQNLAVMQALLGTSTCVALLNIVVTVILVAGGRSDYPRWTAVANPLLWYGIGAAALNGVADQLPHPWGAVLLGGLYNLLMALFFCLSLLTLRRGPV